jgi:hypothetical protein
MRLSVMHFTANVLFLNSLRGQARPLCTLAIFFSFPVALKIKIGMLFVIRFFVGLGAAKK